MTETDWKQCVGRRALVKFRTGWTHGAPEEVSVLELSPSEEFVKLKRSHPAANAFWVEVSGVSLVEVLE